MNQSPVNADDAGVYVTVCRYRLWKANRYRTDALKKLDQLSEALRSGNRKNQSLVQLPALLKETALRAFGREKVASLAGGQWLDFLDQTCGGSDFSDGRGRLLLTLSYRTPAQLQQIPDSDIREVMALVQSWIRRHYVCV